LEEGRFPKKNLYLEEGRFLNGALKEGKGLGLGGPDIIWLGLGNPIFGPLLKI